MSSTRARLAILCDFAEEHWPSMELVAEMLERELRAHHADQFDVTSLRPEFTARFARLPVVGRSNSLGMIDRLINRMHDYPRWLARRADQFDLFHLSDHSYSQLVHVLPADRVGVFCHDLDTFRCLLDPQAEPRPKWFRKMARRILNGMQKARVVFHTTNVVREQILQHGLLDPAKLVQAPYGTASEFNPTATSVELPPQAAGAIAGGFLLHVGSCIPRKRIDVLLDVFAEVSPRDPNLWLIQVGGEWTPAQADQLQRLGISSRVIQLGRQGRPVIAELYRRARIVLMPSESEGFGLPVAEALACGAPVLASDIPVLREVGAQAAMYCPLADIAAWSGTIEKICNGTETPPPLETRLARAAKFSWTEHARIIAQTYLRFDPAENRYKAPEKGLKAMKAIITGGAGFIGCNAASRFLRRGDEVVVIDNLSRRGTQRNLDWLGGDEHRGHGKLTFIPADVADADAMANAFKQHANADLALHLAGQVAVTSSVADPRDDFNANALGTFNVLEAIRKAGGQIPIIYSSTNKVYGGMEDVGIVERNGRYDYADYPDGVSEERGLDFHSPYGCSKGAGDQYVRDYARIFDIKSVVFRQSCIYGYRQFGLEDQGWVAWFIIAVQLGRPITIFGDGMQVRDVLFIDDLIDAYESAAKNINRCAGAVYNVGGGRSNTISLLELVDYLGKKQGKPVQFAKKDWRPGDQRCFISDNRKAERELGWTARTHWTQGLDQLWDWVAANLNLFA